MEVQVGQRIDDMRRAVRRHRDDDHGLCSVLAVRDDEPEEDRPAEVLGPVRERQVQPRRTHVRRVAGRQGQPRRRGVDVHDVRFEVERVWSARLHRDGGDRREARRVVHTRQVHPQGLRRPRARRVLEPEPHLVRPERVGLAAEHEDVVPREVLAPHCVERRVLPGEVPFQGRQGVGRIDLVRRAARGADARSVLP